MPVRWFFVPPGRRTLDIPTVFGSRNWNDPRGDYIPPLGEVKGSKRVWVDGQGPSVGQTGRRCGNDDFWANGQLHAERADFTPVAWGLPPCCGSQPPGTCPTLFDIGHLIPGVLYTLAAGVHSVYSGNVDLMEGILEQILGAGFTFAVGGGEEVDQVRWAAGWTADQACVLIAGTASEAQFIGQALSSVGGVSWQGGFGFNAFAAVISNNLISQLYTAGLPTDVPLTLCGHSLGGSAGGYMAAREQQLRPLRQVYVVTFGEPRMGDSAFAAIMRGRHARIERGGDLVPMVPPDWRQFGWLVDSFTQEILDRWAEFTIPSRGYRSSPEGGFSASDQNEINAFTLLDILLVWLSTGTLPLMADHAIGSYVSDMLAYSNLLNSTFPPCSVDLGEITQIVEELEMEGVSPFYPIATVPRSTTAVAYRAGNSPPSAPDVTLFPCTLWASFQLRVEAGEGDTAAGHFSHIMTCHVDTDIRDDYDEGTPGANNDAVYVPDENGTEFGVRFAEVVELTDGTLVRRVYLDRREVTWPSSDL